MNALIYWHPSVNNEGFKKLIKDLDIKYCAYAYGDTKDRDLDLGIETEGIFLDANPAEYFQELNNCIPLDEEIIIKMEKYSMQAMDIIFRWRSSLETGLSYKNIKRIYFDLMKYWHDFLKVRKIELMLCLDTPHSANEFIIYALCRCMGIATIIVKLMPIVKGCEANVYFQTSFDQIYENFKSDYKKLCKQYKGQSFDDIELTDNLAQYFDEYSGKRKAVKTVVVTERKKPIVVLGTERAKIYISQKRYKTLVKKAVKVATRDLKNVKILKYLETLEQKPDYNEKYVFFPLHLQPEASTCPNAGIWADLDLIAQMVSKALPKDVKLYIKEHPAYWMKADNQDLFSDCRSKDYYDRLNKLPNVKLIDHTVSSAQLIDNAVALVTANGTAGWESIFKQKPVIMFGNDIYQFLDGVIKVNSLEECKNVLDSIIYGVARVPNKMDIAIFLKALENIVVMGSTDFPLTNRMCNPDITKDENDISIANGIYNFIKKAYPELI